MSTAPPSSPLPAPSQQQQQPESPPPPASPLPGATVVTGIMGAVDALTGSLQGGFTVPGEAPAAISSPVIALVTQLDTPGAGSRLFAQPLAAPDGGGGGAAFKALPPDIFSDTAAAAGASAGVATQFLTLAFNPWLAASAGTAAAAAASGGADLAPSLTRLKFSSAADGAEISVSGRSTPIRFTLPGGAAAPDAASGPVCRFYDEVFGVFRGEDRKSVV